MRFRVGDGPPRGAAWALAAILIASLFSCGKGQEKNPSGKTKLLLLDTGIEQVNQKTWRAAIASFEKAHPDATVDFRPYKDDDYSQGGILVAALKSKVPPDVYFEWAWAAVERDAKNGIALDLTPYITPEIKAQIVPSVWSGTSYEGKTYLFPADYVIANLLFYKKKTLADHGIEPPKTWAEFVAACKKLKDAGIQPIFQGNQAAWPAGNWASELAACYLGADRYKQAGERPARTPLTDPGFVEALTRLKELRDVGAFNADMNTLNDNEGLAHFTTGDAAFIFAGSWTLDSLVEAGGEKVFGILPRPALPGVPEGRRYALANSSGYMILAKTPRPDLAFDLLRHAMTLDVQRVRVRGGLATTLLEAQKEVTRPLQLEILANLREAEEWVAAPDISWDRLTAERFYEAVKQVVGGQAEPLPALEAARRDVEQAPK